MIPTNLWYKSLVEWVLPSANYKSVSLTKFICMGTKGDWRMSQQMRCDSDVRVVSQHIVNCCFKMHIDGFVKDCSNSSVLAMELLQSCTKPSILSLDKNIYNLAYGKYKSMRIIANTTPVQLYIQSVLVAISYIAWFILWQCLILFILLTQSVKWNSTIWYLLFVCKDEFYTLYAYTSGLFYYQCVYWMYR